MSASHLRKNKQTNKETQIFNFFNFSNMCHENLSEENTSNCGFVLNPPFALCSYPGIFSTSSHATRAPPTSQFLQHASYYLLQIK